MTAPDLFPATWRTSTRSQDNGDCVEVGARWRTSTRSQDNGSCVEVADLSDGVAVRDSKDRTGPVLRFDAVAWTGFLAAVKAGDHDLPG